MTATKYTPEEIIIARRAFAEMQRQATENSLYVAHYGDEPSDKELSEIAIDGNVDLLAMVRAIQNEIHAISEEPTP